MVSFFRRILTKVDIFGSTVGLNYNKNSMFQTSIGDQVYSDTTQAFQSSPSAVNVSAKNFMFALKIQQDNFIKSPVLNITLSTRDYQTYENGTLVKRKYNQYLVPCTQEHFAQLPSYGMNWTQTFIKYNFNDYLCPQLDYNFTIGGNYNSENFFHWKITVSKCSNKTNPLDTWKPTCPSTEAINKFFAADQNVRFLLYTSNFIVNPSKSQGYVSSYVEDSMIFSIQKDVSYTTADIFFTENQIDTDQSLIPFESIEKETYLSYKFGNLRQQYVVGNQSSIYADFYIRKDSMFYQHTRSFTKIGQILSYIGGFTQIFILITGIIVNYYNDYMYSISLANKLYDFEFSSQTKKKQNSQRPASGKNQINKLKSYQNNAPDKIVEENQNLSISKNEMPVMFKEQKNGIRQVEQIDNNQVMINIQDDNNQNINQKNQIAESIRNSKKKKITTREDDGLISLDKLKFILSERFQSLTVGQKEGDKPSIVKKENELVVIQSEVDFKNQFSNQFYENMKRDSTQIEQKDIMNESITPESPLPKKQQKKVNQNFEEKYHQEQVIDTVRNDGQLLNQQSEEMPNKLEPIPSQITKNLNSDSQVNKKSIFQGQKGLLDGLGIKDKKHFLTKEFEYLLKRQKRITMTFKFFLFKVSFGKLFRSEQVLLLDKAEKQMKKDLDVFVLLNRIKELEKFKALFLDRNQEILFNFFPKPIISISSVSDMPTRAEMTEIVNQLSKKQAKKKNVSSMMKKLKLNFKTALLVTRAVQILKRPLHKKIIQFDSIIAYRKLFEAYEILRSSKQNITFNSKLITLLGDEMNKILEIANLLEMKNEKKQNELSSNFLNQEILNSPKTSKMQMSTFCPKAENQKNNSFQLRPEDCINSGECLFSKQNI